MSTPDYLSLVAEIGAALAGFGTLAGLIGQQGSSDAPDVDAARLRGMLERALAIVILALLPLALGQFLLTETTVWRVSGAALCVAVPLLIWTQILRLRHLTRFSSAPLWYAFGQVNLVLELGLLGAGFAGYVAIEAAYGLVLLIELSVAGSQFLRIIASIRSRP